MPYLFNAICSVNSIVQIYKMIFIYHNFSASILPAEFSVVQWIVTINKSPQHAF